MSQRRIARFCQRHGYGNRVHLIILLFALGHPDKSAARLVLDYHRGVGPAAIAAGRTNRGAVSPVVHLGGAA